MSEQNSDVLSLEEEIEKFFARESKYVSSASSVESIPVFELPEVAFAGRSNVGKSSLINAVTGRNSLARVSSSPGCTKALNFFTLNDKISVVDMPGYGYAKASKREVKGWGKLMFSYLRGRVQLKRIFLLIDGRHGIKDNDFEMMSMLDEYANPYQIILTKCDKVSQTEKMLLAEKTASSIAKHAAAFPNFIMTSSRDKIGIADIRAEIYKLSL